MKLIIDINENVFTRLFDNGIPMDFADGIVMERAIRNGTPIPNNATNGDVMKALFPNIDKGFSNVIDLNLWWNAPYQKGGRNDNNKNV